eukprot:m.449869 g.449869  ORF g.449869 m.449869 type:complete len:660 (+) comp19885_c0_seq1:36-2015(+)
MAVPETSICVSCNHELTPGASVVQFGGATLHPKCYRCAGPCQMQLSVEDTVYTHHAAPWCKRCYAADVERECWRCKENIQFDINGKMAGVGAGSVSFHKECYTCKACNKAFAIAGGDGEKCFEVAGEHYCEQHARDQTAKEDKKSKKAAKTKEKKEKQAAKKVKPNKCGKCKKKDPPPSVLAGGKYWHESCQPCKSCKKTVKDREYIVERGFAYCAPCADKVFMVKCAGCDFRIEAPAAGTSAKHVKLPFGTFHMECFVCSAPGCPNPLIVDGASAAFMDQNKPYCGDHYKARLADQKRAKRKADEALATAASKGNTQTSAASSAVPSKSGTGASHALLRQAPRAGNQPLSLADYSGYSDMMHTKPDDHTYGVPDDVVEKHATAGRPQPLPPTRIEEEGDYSMPEPVGEGEVVDDLAGLYDSLPSAKNGAAPVLAPSRYEPLQEGTGRSGFPPMPPEQVGVTDYECPVPLQPDTYATIDEFSPTPQSGPAAAVLQPDTYAAIDQVADLPPEETNGEYLVPSPSDKDKSHKKPAPLEPEPTYEATYALPADDSDDESPPETLSPAAASNNAQRDHRDSSVSAYDEFQTGRTLQPNTSPGKYDEFKSSPTSTISGQTDAEGTYGLVESLVAPAAPPGSKEQTLNYDNFGAGAGLVPVPKPK